MRIIIAIFLIYSSFVFGETITGKAYVNGKLSYTEKHIPKLSEGGLYDSLQTEYFDETNSKFAFIRSDFKKDKFVPDSFFQDYRLRFSEEIFFDPQTSTVTIKKESKDSKSSEKFRVNANSVSGQGFHNYIVNHFNEILKDKKKISIVVASKKDFYNFVIEKKKEEANVAYFKIYPENFFLKQIVDPIELEYNVISKKLLRFYGLSNLEDGKGKAQIVDIKYEYAD